MRRKHKIESEAGVMALTDEEMILRVESGDAMAFETLVDRYQKLALRVAQRCIGRQAEAEDLVQEAFLQVHRHARQYNREAASFKTWFFSILINLCRNALKRNKSLSSAELPEDAPAIDDPESQLAHEEERAALAAAVARLPPNQRLALILRHYEGFRYSEAAAALGVSVKALGSLLVRAKRTLRRELAEFEKQSSG
ncbi:MAG TPA: sigma-70 family RNA polymerase sigma factor [Blastocatellia bacterium]|nr:sigma-70 family RNA polymerase sigma factor [Blastocatellia bacterium]